jgi:alkylhydroperoxidase/carboxymuconolactone decarboxylase family protein YurZ
MTDTRAAGSASETKQTEIEGAMAEHDWGTPAMNALAKLDPDFMHGFVQFYNACTAKNALDGKTRELIFVAIDAATTHLYNTGTLFHIQQARKQGATVEEILEVLEIVTLLGVHSMSEGIPLLLQALDEEKKTS